MIDRRSLRLSATLLLAGQILYILVTQFHTGGEANNHAAIFAAFHPINDVGYAVQPSDGGAIGATAEVMERSGTHHAVLLAASYHEQVAYARRHCPKATNGSTVARLNALMADMRRQRRERP
jgi:hypothetical protein